MLKFLQPVWRTACIAALIATFKVAVEVLSVYFLSPAVTTVATMIKSEAPGGFLSWIIGTEESARRLREVLTYMLGTQVLLGAMIYLRSVWDTKLSMHVVYFMRSAVYDRLQRAHLSLYDRMTSGQLINRAIGDLQNVRSFVNMSLLSTLDIFVSIVLYMGLLFLRSPWLMLAALLPVPLWWLAIARFGRRARPLSEAQQTASDNLMTAMSENLYGVHVVRAFGTEEQEIAKYHHLNETLLTRTRKSIGLQARLTPTLKVIGTSAHALLFVFAAWLVREGKIEVGDVMLLGATMAALLGKLQSINQMAEAHQKAMVSARRLFEILDLPVAVEDRQSHPQLNISAGQIEFRDIDFSYGGSRVLQGVSAMIPGGSITAVVGPTGSGKSTLAGLIARFNDPQNGSVLIDGQDLQTVDLKDLRRQIAFVFQETFLFSGTVRDNILYGREDISEEMMRRAARVSQADEFIESLPQGYDTVLGDRGVLLSGGQRQRLALARALVYDPRILILDDATAALDARTEMAIHNGLDPIFEGRTVLLIAHRLASVEAADHVLVMNNGKICQSGTHEELLRLEGHYRDLIRAHLQAEAGGLFELETKSEKIERGSA